MVQAAMRRYNEIADKKDRGMTKEEILVHAGHTLLKAVSTRDEIQTLCEEAIENRTASVCIPPGYVKRVSNAYGDKLNVCTVIGFPLGYNITETKVYETRRVLADGAGEVDMVVILGDVKKVSSPGSPVKSRQLKRQPGGRNPLIRYSNHINQV